MSTVRTALTALGAAAVTLLLLTLYTATGAAGEGRPEIAVVDGMVLEPTNDRQGSAYFTLRNTGEGADRLLSVSSPDVPDGVMLSRVVVRDGGGSMRPLDSVAVPAGQEVRMDPWQGNVMLNRPPGLVPGQPVRFVLRFAVSGEIEAVATTVTIAEYGARTRPRS
ncbi:copper chaperone PCu(A)C [Streptomyces sp. JJ38]|uniref:copper chaperone PCu(A)C n=1 Tax=Streptomyces sp. JJ38 TaxID=2738128 RepID=UPI001C5944AC|nr:copper chaperone PCu(A)C [Streptomyces sp. JJ38]MBW1597471.1 copper chaperone PCu(A)C [Streptomyces sp. JJ38]